MNQTTQNSRACKGGFVFLLLLAACQSSPQAGSRLSSSPEITKGQTLYQSRMESTPVIFQGQQIDVVSYRDPAGTTGKSVELHVSSEITTAVAFPYGYISALVLNGELWIFGTSDWSHAGNAIFATHSADLVSWSSPQLVLQADAQTTLWNTSVTQTDTGYLMASEHAPGAVSFYSSQDLIDWQTAGTFTAEGYAACPTIRFVGGYYYVTYLWQGDSYFATRIARSADLISWEYSAQAVISPDADEGYNASDLDLVETPNGVRILYAIGCQVIAPGSWFAIREASAPGTLADFLGSFFPAQQVRYDVRTKHYPHSREYWEVRKTA